MPNQVLIIEPNNELEFKIDFAGLFQKDSTTYMWLTNPTTDKVLFKIKTTAPKKYCVRPNSGKLEPNAKIEIAITPQTLYVDPNEKQKHKFMVQSIIVPQGQTNFDQIWKEITPDQLMDYKLKCVFTSESATGNTVNETLKQGDADGSNQTATKTSAVPLQNKAMEKLKEDFKTSTPIKSSNASKNDTQIIETAAAEIVQLREEGSKLSHENLQLREEIVRLRRAAGDANNVSQHTFRMEKTNDVAMMAWLITGVFMAFLGVIIGKFFI